MPVDTRPEDLPPNFLDDFQRLMFPPSTSESDRLRWYTQGIYTKGMKEPPPTTASASSSAAVSHHGWGIVQSNGGPCAVMAVCAGEIIRSLDLYKDCKRKVTPEEAEWALCEALGIILARSCMALPVDLSKVRDEKYVKLVLPKSEDASLSMADLSGSEGNAKFHIVKITPEGSSDGSSVESMVESLAKTTAQYISEGNRVKRFQEGTGVILFLLSLIATRGMNCIRNDMDDPQNSHLTAQFAHSSQELINLLLTGQATSNTFDGSVNLGSGISCNGPQSQSTIGYLTQLEVLRYCSVGSFFKSPKFPIWIVGSTSHFTVLFGPEECLVESQSDVLLEKCRNAFKSIDNAEENGYISVDSLDQVLKKLDLDLGSGVAALKASIEVSSAGIILWSDFWRTVSCLMTGATLESVLDQNMKRNSNTVGTAAGINNAASSAAAESDEELARRLAEEWGSGQDQNYNNAVKSDEEFARELQAQFQSESVSRIEEDVVMSDRSNGGAIVPYTENNVTLPQSNNETIQSEAQSEAQIPFEMYHYNTLRSGEMTTLKVIRQSALEAVGQDIPLSSADVGGSSHDNDLAAVVRTKFNSCKCSWEGQQSPSLH